jgi:hypothetical protein
MSDWLPSQRSTLHQMGGVVMVRLGHGRPGKVMGLFGWYFLLGEIIIVANFSVASVDFASIA